MLFDIPCSQHTASSSKSCEKIRAGIICPSSSPKSSILEIVNKRTNATGNQSTMRQETIALTNLGNGSVRASD